MRKGTKKKVINGILIIIVIIFALLASLIAAFRDVTIQSMIARSLAGNLSEKLNTEVKIKTFYITENFTVCVEDVQINDLSGYPLFMIGRLDAKFSPIISLNDFKIKDIYVKDVVGRIVKYEGDENLNFKDVMLQLGGANNEKKEEEEDEESDFSLRIDNLKVDNCHVVYWDQNRHNVEKYSFDWYHIDIDSIYGEFNNLEIRHDTIAGDVLALKGKDRCGLTLDSLSGNTEFCDKSLTINNLLLHTNESHLDLDLRFEYNNLECFDEFEDSVKIISDIRPTTMLLSDLKYFSWIMRKMPDKFYFNTRFEGYVNNFTVTNFDAYFGNESHFDADLSFTGVTEFFDAYIDANIRELSTSYEDTKNFAIPIESETVPIPESLKDLGKYTLSGSYQGYAEDFNTQFKITSEMGNIDAQLYLNTKEQFEYSLILDVKDLETSKLINSNEISDMSFDIEMSGRGLDIADAELEADLHFSSLNIHGDQLDDLKIHSDLENQRLITITNINHPDLVLDLSTMIDFKGQEPSYNIIAKIDKADLVNLNLLDSDSIMQLSTKIDVQFCGNDIDNITGKLNIDSTRYYNGEEFLMNKFTANVSEISDIKDVSIDCDFFNFYGYGIVNAKTFVNTVKNTAKRYVNIPAWFSNTVPDTHKQEFSILLELKDTETLSKLFMPSLHISKGTMINASYTDGYAYHGSTIESDEIIFNGLKFKNVDIRNNAKFDEFTSNIFIDNIILRDTVGTKNDMINLENISLLSRFGNDTIKIDLNWNDDEVEDHNIAKINSTFVPHSVSGGLLSIQSDLIIINDTLWKINPDCNIDFKKSDTDINNFDLFTDNQMISVHGLLPYSDTDTLHAEFKNLDISDFNFITSGNGILFEGKLNGFVGISGLNENMSFSSDIDLNKFKLNDQNIGDISASAKWYDPKESIFVNLVVYNDSVADKRQESIGALGFYYPRKNRDNLSFDMFFNDFNLVTLSPFIDSEVDRIGGFVSGNLKLRGSLDEPDILGNVKLNGAGCRINYLNTFYTLYNDIKLEEDKIIFENVVITDTLSNSATVNGVINHKHLKDFDLDINVECNDFLALNIPAEHAEGFYGTAVTDGTVQIKGPFNDLHMTIDAVTKKGTEISVPLSSTSSVDNNFVVFVQENEGLDTITERFVPEVVKSESNFTMDLDAEINSDAEVNIYLPQNMGSINARGNGNININMDAENFGLRGDYTITNGSFVFKLEMIRRTFNLRNGGTLHWTGDPTDADINIVGVYRTKSSLNSLGAQAVDSTAMSSNINVDCIIRLTDKLMNPTITFGIELPNATDDTRGLVYSIIDTTNQAVMAQQVFSLLVLGSFSNTAGNNVSRLGTTAGYNVITSQLSNWLSQISKDVDVGINYTPNDQLTNEEIEVALSTQLFDDRLIIEGNFGVIRGNKNDADNANDIVGDVDLTFRLTKRLSLKAYNHTNVKNNYYIYSVEEYSDFTQGVGISFSQSFDNVREIFHYNNRNKNKKTKKTKLKLDDESKPK